MYTPKPVDTTGVQLPLDAANDIAEAMKLWAMEKGATQDDMYELIGVEKKANQTSAFEFRPVGSGLQDFPAIIDASKDAGADWIIVEQDQPSMGLTSLECIEKSRKYLKSIGY